MSYDVCLKIDTGGEFPAIVEGVGSYTYNVSAMFEKAGAKMSDLHLANAGESIERLEKAVAHMEDPANKAEYSALNPRNGWGNHEGATRFVQHFLNACRRHPKATIYVS